MTKITLLCIGKVKESWIRQGILEFEKRIRHFEVKELKDSNKEKEGKEILQFLDKLHNTTVFLLDEHGTAMASVQFAEVLKKQDNLCFVIGGPDGLSEEVLKKIQKKISLSSLTFTHEMARLFFIEQLYRAVSINEGKKYHR